ncbi:MAG: hypothetical protein HRT65_16180 [Flavobacteriaceae bacterium]|nr:hypothetical protein [Flavobacteriaceae bacterium]
MDTPQAEDHTLLDVDHYLTIYKGRKRMMETGITDPPPQGRQLILEIVAKLATMPADAKIRIGKKDGHTVMMDVDGETIVTFPKLETNRNSE